MITTSLELKVGDLYSYSDLSKELSLQRFYSSRSLWTDGIDTYLFHHIPMKKLKLRFEYSGLMSIRYSTDVNNCFNPARMGL